MQLKQLVPSEMNPPLRPTLVLDAAGLEEVTQFLSTTVEFGLDIETSMTDHFFTRRVRTIQIGTRERQFIIDLLAFAGTSEALLNGMGRYTPSAWAKPVVEALKPFLESDKYLKIGQGLGFECEMFKWCLGIRLFHLYDTLEVEKVLNAGLVSFFQPSFWGLEDLTARYCGLAISKEQQTTFNLTDPLTEEQIIYGAIDARLPVSIKGAQSHKIEKAKLHKAVQIENDAIPAFADLHLNGLLIDLDAWNAELDRVKIVHQQNANTLDTHFLPIVGPAQPPFTAAQLAELELEWRSCFEKDRRAEKRKSFQAASSACTEWRKKAAKFEGKANVQYGSPAQLLAALRKAGYDAKKLVTTKDDYLELLEGDEIIDAIREYRSTEKTLSSYGQAYLDEHVNKNTGRIHSRFTQNGAETGRTTSSKPNVQNINKESAWRSCFVAPPGHVILTIDYNGCELRILAEASGEKVWIDAFNAGWDVHSVGAEIIFEDRWKNAACKGGEVIIKKGKEVVLPPCAYYNNDHEKCECPEHKKLRDYIKAINFGIAYGMEAKKLARKLRIKVKEAQELLEKYRKTFAAVTDYLNKSGESAKITLESRTLAGRVRYFSKPSWDRAIQIAQNRAKEDGKAYNSSQVSRAYSSMYGSIEREGKNSPIQGTNADMIKLSMGCGVGYLWQALEPVYGAYLLNIVHDELVIQAPEEKAKECFEFAVGCMVRAGGEFLKSVVAKAEGAIEKCWAKG